MYDYLPCITTCHVSCTLHVWSSKKRAGEDLVLLSPTRRRLDDDITRPTIDQPPAEPDVLDANGQPPANDDDITRPTIDQPPAEPHVLDANGQPPAKPQPTDAMVDDAGEDGPSRVYYKPSTVRDAL